MLKFLKLFPCYWADSAERAPVAVWVEQTYDNGRFVLPHYSMDHEDSVKVTTLRTKLPGCKRKDIKVKIGNKRLLQVLAASQFNCYKLQLKLPREARLLSKPSFSHHDDVLTCRFHGPAPRCKSCGRTFSRHSTTKDVCKLVEARYWVPADDNMAPFETNLEGCKYSSQIEFHLANSHTLIPAFLSLQRRCFLELCWESSAAAEAGWKVDFDEDLQTFTCTIIPLLGSYEHCRCMAARENDVVPNRERNGHYSEKVVRVDADKAAGRHSKLEGRDSPTRMHRYKSYNSTMTQLRTSKTHGGNISRTPAAAMHPVWI